MSITQDLELSVSTFLSSLFEKMYSYDVDCFDLSDSEGTLEVVVQQTEDTSTRTIVLRLSINHAIKQLHLTNIFIPMTEHNKGYGFGLLNEILTVANLRGYQLFIVEMVPSFYSRMISKGAKPVVEAIDEVLVDDKTQLLSHRS